VLVRREKMPWKHVFKERAGEEEKASSYDRWTAEGGCPHTINFHMICSRATKTKLGDTLVVDGGGRAERKIAVFGH